VLTVTAWDGVFLAGDLLREIAPTLKQSDFRKSLEAKGRLGKMIERLPVCYPNIAETRLIGAAAALAAKASDVETVGCALKAVA
jgi:glucokinase